MRKGQVGRDVGMERNIKRGKKDGDGKIRKRRVGIMRKGKRMTKEEDNEREREKKGGGQQRDWGRGEKE